MSLSHNITSSLLSWLPWEKQGVPKGDLPSHTHPHTVTCWHSFESGKCKQVRVFTNIKPIWILDTCLKWFQYVSPVQHHRSRTISKKSWQIILLCVRPCVCLFPWKSQAWLIHTTKLQHGWSESEPHTLKPNLLVLQPLWRPGGKH